MSVVPQEAINQFEALMEEGRLALISYLFCFLICILCPISYFSAHLFVILLLEICAVDEPLKRTFKVALLFFPYFLTCLCIQEIFWFVYEFMNSCPKSEIFYLVLCNCKSATVGMLISGNHDANIWPLTMYIYVNQLQFNVVRHHISFLVRIWISLAGSVTYYATRFQ